MNGSHLFFKVKYEKNDTRQVRTRLMLQVHRNIDRLSVFRDLYFAGLVGVRLFISLSPFDVMISLRPMFKQHICCRNQFTRAFS